MGFFFTLPLVHSVSDLLVNYQRLIIMEARNELRNKKESINISILCMKSHGTVLESSEAHSAKKVSKR